MEDFIKVDVNQYVKEGLESGLLEPFEAEKFARIIAKKGQVGEIVTTWSEDKNNDAPIKEKEDVIKLDEQTNESGWIVTKVNENGEPIIDKFGHDNTWIIEDSTFKKSYVEAEKSGMYKKPGTSVFVEISDNITLNQWGSDMDIAKGGFINITDENDMYGISARDFEDTYRAINEKSKSINR